MKKKQSEYKSRLFFTQEKAQNKNIARSEKRTRHRFQNIFTFGNDIKNTFLPNYGAIEAEYLQFVYIFFSFRIFNE